MNDDDEVQNPFRPESDKKRSVIGEQDLLKRKLNSRDCHHHHHHRHHQLSTSPKKKQHLNVNADELGLTLGHSSPTPFPFPIPPPTTAHPALPSGQVPASPRRRNARQSPKQGKSDTVPAPYPWATNKRATVRGLDYLVANNLGKIRGTVQCKRCEKQFEVEYDLVAKFGEVYSFITGKLESMHQRAPGEWMNPVLATCRFCEQENSGRPVMAEKKKGINWLFLLLGQMLGCCTLKQLKYLCKHTRNHRTGAKDRLLYLTYLELCKQLYPSASFD